MRSPIRTRWVSWASMGCAVLAMSLACGGDGGTGPTLTSLQLVGDANRTAVVGSSVEVTVHAVNASGGDVSNAPITFAVEGGGSVSEASVRTGAAGRATVEWELGTVAGEQRLTATAGSGAALGAIVRVTALPGPASTVSIAPATLTIPSIGEERVLVPSAEDAFGNDVDVAGTQVTWTIDDESVATIAAGGRVRSVGPGSATVTATIEGKAGVATVVVAQSASVVSIMAPAGELRALGRTMLLAAEVRDAGGHVVEGAPVEWMTLDPAIATVSEAGLVTALATGTARIRATSGSASATFELVVRQVVAAVHVTPDTTFLDPGDTLPLAAQAVDSGGAEIPGAQFTWGSGDSEVATVSAQGIVTALRGGVSSVSATYQNESGVSEIVVAIDLAERTLAGANTHSVFLQGAEVWSAGDNRAGQLGTANTDGPRLLPVRSPGAPAFIQIDSREEHVLALADDGSVWSWGRNDREQLGYATTERCFITSIDPDVPCSTIPRQVSGLADIIAVAAGRQHSLALRRDGTVWAWGWNHFGQLGDGNGASGVQSRIPVRVRDLTDVVSIGAGSAFSIAARRDGTVWTWGSNQSGSLCDGSDTDRMTPVRVTTIRDVVSVAGIWFTSVALRRDGTVWACGSNNFGQVGSGAQSDRIYLMTRTSGLTRIRGIAGGGYHGIALRDDGSVFTWGRNSFGQLGHSSGITTVRTPAQVPGLTSATAVAAGTNHTVARTGDGSAWAWGLNTHGQLGIGTTENAATPQRVQIP